jgi:hypothetical protein
MTKLTTGTRNANGYGLRLGRLELRLGWATGKWRREWPWVQLDRLPRACQPVTGDMGTVWQLRLWRVLLGGIWRERP